MQWLVVLMMYNYMDILCKESLGVKIKNKCWVHIVARMTFEYSDEYQEEEGILSPISIKVISPLKNPILDLR